jgi:hypothetical protein
MRIGQVATLLFFTLLAVILALCTQYSFHSAGRQQEFPQATDRFGYLQMAQDFRRRSAPHDLPPYTVDSPHARLLLDFLRTRPLPLDNNDFVGPPAYHYVASSRQIICQYPPGVAWMLGLFPPGGAVFTWQLITMAALLLVPAWSFVTLLQRPTVHAATALAFAAAMAMGGILMIGSAISYSVDLVLLPLLIAIAAACAAGNNLQTTAATEPPATRFRAWLPPLLALLSGAMLGWAMVVRLAAALLLPGFLPLLCPQSLRRFWKSPALFFLIAFALTGPLPTMLHDRALTGAPLHSTYTPADTAFSLQAIPKNLHYYFWGDGSDRAWFFLAIAAAFAAARWASRRHAPPRPRPSRPLLAILLWFIVPTAYLLCHAINTPYYQQPTLFACLAGMALLFLRTPRAPAPPVPPPAPSQQSPILLLAAPALCVLAMLVAAATLAPLGPDDSYQLPDVSLPEPLRDPRAWIIADRLTGTFWYYHGILAHSILHADPDTRRAFYQFVRSRGEPLYLVYDDPLLKELSPELLAARVRLTPIGRFADSDVYRIDWPTPATLPPPSPPATPRTRP